MEKSLRLYINVKGIVQGVGFRPFVYKTALECNLAGWVANSPGGVDIEVQGYEKNIKKFLELLTKKAPQVSKIEHISTNYTKLQEHENSFIIRSSVNEGYNNTEICPDINVCEDCINEMLDPTNRRYQYPFINCTNCGPRYSIIRNLPYDRPNTTMKCFSMCDKCLAEYTNPKDRRFHAQPVSCHECGPRLFSADTDTQNIKDIIEYAINILKSGKIIALKGIGGFHLVCDASQDEPVLRLRNAKTRDKKPFAIMVPNMSNIDNIAVINKRAEEYLKSSPAPIVILKKGKMKVISEHIAPKLDSVGIFLPYTPLHHQLFYYNSPQEPHFRALVMTSANRTSKPLIRDENDFDDSLRNVVDEIVSHDRVIENRIDDSVIKPCNSGIIFLRRSRGYAPFTLKLPNSNQPTLCMGSEKKNTIALTKDNHCYISQYIGDIKDIDTYDYMHETVEKSCLLYGITPQRIAFDMHPLYENSRWARKSNYKKIEIPHHHAHIASVTGEYNFEDPVIGIAFDGSGYGDDGNIWGGEFFIVDRYNYKRISHLKYISLQGGDQGIREPYRTGISYLYNIYKDEIYSLNIPIIKDTDPNKLELILQGLKKGINTYQTSSIGRLFDAIASLTGLRYCNRYEGQASMELESFLPSNPDIFVHYPYVINHEDDMLIIDPDQMILSIINDIYCRVDLRNISLKFHNTINGMILKICQKIRNFYGISDVALSGGVFQNRYLRDITDLTLRDNGFRPMYNNRVSPGDEGISFGQAVISNQIL